MVKALHKMKMHINMLYLHYGACIQHLYRAKRELLVFHSGQGVFFVWLAFSYINNAEARIFLKRCFGDGKIGQ